MRTSVLMTVVAICPVAPPGAEVPTEQITGYVLWGVLILFMIGVVIGIGAILGGRIFSMPHASKAGVVSLVVVFVAVIAYLVLPGMLNGILGDGCVPGPPAGAPTGQPTEAPSEKPSAMGRMSWPRP